MQSSIEFLSLYSEVTIAYVAFMAIVATLRHSFGERLSAFQYLLVRFFVEVGLIHVLLSMLAVALFHALESELLVWRIVTYGNLATAAFYLPYYVRRRRRAQSGIPPGSLFVMVGYAVAVLVMAATTLERWWAPSLLTVSLYYMWVAVGNVIVFFIFLGSFLRVAEATEG